MNAEDGKSAGAAAPGAQHSRWAWPLSWAQTGSIVLFSGALTALWIGMLRWDANVYRENGPMENFQAICLALGALTTLWLAWRSRSEPSAVLFAGMALLFLTFFLREVDLRDSHPRLYRIMHGTIRDIWVGGLWFLGAVWFWRRRREVWPRFTTWIRTPSGGLMVLAGVLWILGSLMEKADFLQPQMLIEELIEVNAAFWMLGAAVLAVKNQEKDGRGGEI